MHAVSPLRISSMLVMTDGLVESVCEHSRQNMRWCRQKHGGNFTFRPRDLNSHMQALWLLVQAFYPMPKDVIGYAYQLLWGINAGDNFMLEDSTPFGVEFVSPMVLS